MGDFSIFSRLPPHIILDIARHAINQPKPQLEILRVCSDFYLAAIPILYHSPHVTSCIDSFFLHTTEEVSADFSSLTPRQLVQAGQTKLAALHYVKILHIDIALPVYDTDPRNSRFRLQRTLTIVRSLPSKFMPSLSVVRCGAGSGNVVSGKYEDPATFTGQQSDHLPARVIDDTETSKRFSSMFMERCGLPFDWCIHVNAYGFPSIIAPPKVYDSEPQPTLPGPSGIPLKSSPPKVHLHVLGARQDGLASLLSPGKTHVFHVPPEECYRSITNMIMRLTKDPKLQSIPPVNPIITRLIICGEESRSPIDPWLWQLTANIRGCSVAKEVFPGQSLLSIAETMKRYLARRHPDLLGMELEILKEEDMPLCSGCGENWRSASKV